MRGYGSVRPVVLRIPTRLLEELDRDLASRRRSWGSGRTNRTFFLIQLVAGELALDLRGEKRLTKQELEELDASRLERRSERARRRAAAR